MFHNPDTLALSHEEKMELAKKQKIIKHDNTRLARTPWKTDKQVPVPILYTGSEVMSRSVF